MKKLIFLVCISLITGPAAGDAGKDPARIPGMDPGLEFLSSAAGSRAPFRLADDMGFRYNIDTLHAPSGSFWGTCIDEVLCTGGDIRGLFTGGGEMAIAVYNIGR